MPSRNGACRASSSTTWTAAPRTRAPSRANCEAFARLRFRPRTLVDVGRSATSRRDCSARPRRCRLVVGPTGLNGLSWRDGDLELARAATAAGAAFRHVDRLDEPRRGRRARGAGPAVAAGLRVLGTAHHRGDHAARARGRLRVRDADERFPGRRQARARPAHRLLPQQRFTLAHQARHADASALARDGRDAPPALRQCRARARTRPRRQCLRRPWHVRSRRSAGTTSSGSATSGRES